MTNTNLVIELEKTFGFQGHSPERRRLEALALIRLYANQDYIQASHDALRCAINSVECASVDPITSQELPWYKLAKNALHIYEQEIQ